jgi:hypothetical protein
MRMPCAGSFCSRASASSSGWNGPARAASRPARARAPGTRRGRFLVDALGLVGEQHGVAVERDPHLLRMRVDARAERGKDARRRAHRLERGADVGLVRGQEKVGGERLQVAPRRPAAREDATLDRHPYACAERNTRIPETGSLRDRMTTSTRCAAHR